MKQTKNGQFGGGKAHGAASHQLAGDPRRFLAARLSGGTRWDGKEVPMWKRSEVEQLTGLTRHMIQDLCNQNTSGDGLAFWVPAVSKPGYSRFDEGDLLAFYLVRQLSKAGFTLAEVEPAVISMLEEDNTFGECVAAKARQLESERAAIDAKLAATDVLERAVGCAPEERLYAIMGAALTRGAMQAVDAASQEIVPKVDGRTTAAVREACCTAVPELLSALGWSTRTWMPGAEMAGSTSWGGISAANRELAAQIGRFAEAVADALCRDVAPNGIDAIRMVRWGAGALWNRWHPKSTLTSDGEALRLVLAAARAFLAQAENGVPVELALGKGSFDYLAKATDASVEISAEAV